MLEYEYLIFWTNPTPHTKKILVNPNTISHNKTLTVKGLCIFVKMF